VAAEGPRPAAEATHRGPDARLSPFDVSMVVVSVVIGIGIFRTPALVASSTGTGGLFLAAWGIGGAISLIGALVFAEIGSRYPRAGGCYSVVAHCWHPIVAFVLNWSQVLMQGAGAGGVALIGAEYLLRLTSGDSSSGRSATLIAAVLLSGLVLLNLAGIRAGSRAQNVLSLAKIVLIAGLAAAGLALAPSVAPAELAAPDAGAAAGGLLGALVAVFYAYGGYQTTMNLGGDARDARRSMALSICGGMAIVTLLYLAINFAYLRALGMGTLAGSPLVAADLAHAALGRWGEAFVSLSIFLSAAGFVNATILQLPRTYVAMAQDGLVPASLGRIDPRTRAQRAGLMFFAATSLGPLLLLRSFENLLGYVMFTDALSLVVMASCLAVLRKRGEGDSDPRTFRMPGYPWLPGVFMLVLLGVAADIAIRQPRLALAGTAIAAIGVPLYAVMKRTWGARL
jgi:basic amino acid/polyamine antiporter, APA family